MQLISVMIPILLFFLRVTINLVICSLFTLTLERGNSQQQQQQQQYFQNLRITYDVLLLFSEPADAYVRCSVHQEYYAHNNKDGNSLVIIGYFF